jgi:hypothetical protein
MTDILLARHNMISNMIVARLKDVSVLRFSIGGEGRWLR